MSIPGPRQSNENDELAAAKILNVKIPVFPRSNQARGCLQRYQRGDEEAFGLFYDLMHVLVETYAVARTDDSELTAEIMRITFRLAKMCVSEMFDLGITAEAWILRIAREVANDKTNDSFGLAIVAYGEPHEQHLQVLKQLPSLPQECMTLRVIMGLNTRIVGEVLGLPEKEIILMHYRATQSIAALLRL